MRIVAALGYKNTLGYLSHYRGQRVLVTGGLGFIGSNVALQLAKLGAAVTVVDSCVEGCGANRHNLAGAAGVSVIASDIANAASFSDAIRECDTVFNLAGEISHIHSMRLPWRDAELNATAQLKFLDECARANPGVRIVYASTRQIYGVPEYLPVDEAHPVRPVDFNGIHKYAAHAYHLLYSQMAKVDAYVLCLTNVYGPRMALNIPCQGFLGNFLRRSLFAQAIEIFGDGRQLRDPVYVDDAVDAFLRAGAATQTASRVWNLGGPQALALRDVAEIMSRLANAPEPSFRPFPEEHKRIDIGSFAGSSDALTAALGWHPTVLFEEGIRRSLDYYRREFAFYLKAGDVRPSCALESEAAHAA